MRSSSVSKKRLQGSPGGALLNCIVDVNKYTFLLVFIRKQKIFLLNRKDLLAVNDLSAI